ncbi:MAG: hypothetical protein ACK44L_12070 [Burkholderiales bacterium]|jgi:hypothetical protein
MRDRAADQASGLRQVMAHRDKNSGALVNLLGAGEHAPLLARLVQIWADAGGRITVITDFDLVFSQLRENRRRFGLTVLHAMQLGLSRGAIERIALESDLTVLALDDNRLARGFDLPACAQLVLSDSSPEAVATAYVRLKACAGLGSPTEVCTLFDRGSAPTVALAAHQRLAHAASRFLGLRLDCAGVAPEPIAVEAWQRLAGSIGRWAGQRSVAAQPVALH